MRETFDCNCADDDKRSTVIISDSEVQHACGFRPSASFPAGIVTTWERVQVNPALTGGVVKYNWFRRWES